MGLIKKLVGLFSSGRVKENQSDAEESVIRSIDSRKAPFEGIQTDKRELLFQWYKKKIDNLKRFLGDFERVVVEYEGPSPEFIKHCSDNDVNFPLYEKTTFGTRDGVARKQLSELFEEDRVPHENMIELIDESVESPVNFFSPKVPKKARYYAGLALGYKPIEILKKFMPDDRINRDLYKIIEDASRKGVELEAETSRLVL